MSNSTNYPSESKKKTMEFIQKQNDEIIFLADIVKDRISFLLSSLKNIPESEKEALKELSANLTSVPQTSLDPPPIIKMKELASPSPSTPSDKKQEKSVASNKNSAQKNAESKEPSTNEKLGTSPVISPPVLDVSMLPAVSDRKLAYVAEVKNLEPIEGADVIEVATILGWKVVVKKGKYKIGDYVVYAEIDSILPPWPSFIEDKLDKVKFRIKTVKLRGQISQGYCIPLSALPENPSRKVKLSTSNIDGTNVPCLVDTETNEQIVLSLGTDLTDFIGIVKYEPQDLEISLRFGKGRPFPSFIPKTDQERIQNLVYEISKWENLTFEVTEKLEGSSLTVFFNRGAFGICSRNFELLDLETTEHTGVRYLMKTGIDKALITYGKHIALQGELIGKGIQGNIYKIAEYDWRIFDVYLIDEQRYALPEERYRILQEINWSKSHVPIIEQAKSIKGMTVADFLKMAEGNSQLRKQCQREGLVFKGTSLLGNKYISFKAISNTYLLKNEM